MEQAKNNDISLIERYFNLDLSEKEIDEFDQRLQIDPEFASKVNSYHSSIALVDQSYPDQDNRQRHNKWSKLINNDNPSSKNKSQLWLIGIAASIIVICTTWYYTSISQPNNIKVLTEKAWAKHVGFSDYQVRNSSEIKSKKTVIQSFKAYKNKKYTVAIATVKNHDPSVLYYEDALLIKALSTYKMGNHPDALETLDSLLKLPSNRLKKEALWYKGLIYIDLNDLETAKKYLIIPDNTSAEIRLKESTH